jgi:heme exporter protein B
MLLTILKKEFSLLGSSMHRIFSFLSLMLSLLFIFHYSLEKYAKLDQTVLVGLKWCILFLLSYLIIGQMTEDETESSAYQITKLFLPVYLEYFTKSITIFIALFTIGILENFFLVLFFETYKFNLEQLLVSFYLLIPGCLSLCFLGVLLSDLSKETGKKEFILPVLLIPLSIPVLITSIDLETKFLLQNEVKLYSLVILFSFSILYLSLGMLFREYILD